MQRLYRPPIVYQSRSQVIEQLGVRRPLAKLAEIAGCAHDSLPEMKCPNAIGDHSRGERIGRAGDRLGQLQSAAAARKGRRLASAEDAQIAPGGQLPGRLRTAPTLPPYGRGLFR